MTSLRSNPNADLHGSAMAVARGPFGTLHYVYDVPFYGAMAAPALLVLAMVLNHVIPDG